MLYKSTAHVAATIAILCIPFVFLLFFAGIAHISAQTLFTDVLVSSVRLLIAYLIAVALSWVIAVVSYQGRASVVLLPLFDVLQSFPTFAALPLATFLWGPSNKTVVLFLVLTVIWPIFFTLISSLKLARHDWQEAVMMARLKKWQYLWWYLIPITVPGLITGSIIGLGEGWEAIVATEMIVNVKHGLGPFFQTFSQNVMMTSLGILALLILIFVINKVLWIPLLEWSHRRMES